MPPTGVLNLTWGNDGLNYLVPADGLTPGRLFHDDDGFTNDLSLSATIQRKLGEFNIFARHRMITERGGLHREDEFLTEARWERIASHLGRGRVFAFLGLGFVATGNLGGAILQDRFHHLIHWGRYLEGKLQNIYEGELRLGPRVAVGGTISYPVSKQVQVFAGTEADVSRDVGVSSGQVSATVERHWSLGGNWFSLWGKLALRHLHSEEERLTFHGGYPKEATFLEGACGFSYTRGAKAIGFSLILNQEGTGVHSGVLSLSYLLGD